MTVSITWRDAAACAGEDFALFFPADGPPSNRAVAICWACPVRRACLETALEHEAGRHHAYRAGLWGGLSPKDRYQLDRCRSGICAHDDCPNGPGGALT